MLIFLDFDGVLHAGNPTRADRRFTRMPLLADWLRRWSQVEVVISSAWRKERSLDELRAFFPEDLRHRVIDATPQLDWDPFVIHAGPLYEREGEIRQWLHASARPWRPWAALDDSPWLFKPFTKQLVACEIKDGLTVDALAKLEMVLGLTS